MYPLIAFCGRAYYTLNGAVRERAEWFNYCTRETARVCVYVFILIFGHLTESGARARGFNDNDKPERGYYILDEKLLENA